MLPPLLFAHAGDAPIPHYAPVAWRQARLLNPSLRILCAAPAKHLSDPWIKQELASSGIEGVPLESLNGFQEEGMVKARLAASSSFLVLISVRYLILEALMEHFQLDEAFHLENDVMLYLELDKLIGPLRELYAGRLATPFDCDTRAVPGFMYLSGREGIAAFNRYILDTSIPKPDMDMERFGCFGETDEGRRLLGKLPIISEGYFKLHGFKSTLGVVPKRPEDYFEGLSKLGVLFDAAALGQYLGGPDPRGRMLLVERGFLNESCVFQADKLSFSWELDAAGLRRPFVSVGGERFPVATLHIHSKALEEFLSDRFEPLHDYLHGDLFRELADLAVLKNGKAVMKKGFQGLPKTLYVDGDMIPFFFERMLPKFPPDSRLVVINTNDDNSLPVSSAGLLDDPRIFRWFAVNIPFEHPKLRALPLGIARPFWPHGSQRALDSVARLEIPKRGLLYMNFSPSTNPSRRSPELEALSKQPFVLNGGRKAFKLYLEEQKGFHFSVCPHGNGLDSHRVWECLYTGVIPVVPDCPLYRSFPELPLLRVKSWGEIDERMLVDALGKMKFANMRMLDFRYWRHEITAAIREAGR